MNEERTTKKDPVFIIGRDLLKEGKYDEAIEFFDGVLQQRAKEFGNDMSIGCASAWYEYGNALLTKEEDAPSDGLLANSEKPIDSHVTVTEENEEESGENSVPADIEVLEEGKVETNENENEEGGEGEGEEGEEVNDLQIAWESFEVCRKIYESYRSNYSLHSSSVISKSTMTEEAIENELALSHVYIRLGDLQIINNKFPDALEDYHKALEIRIKLCVDFDRLLSDVYYSMALAYVYSSTTSIQSTTEDNVEPTEVQKQQTLVNSLMAKKKALEFYILTKEVMMKWVEHRQSSLKGLETEEDKEKANQSIISQKEMIDELEENIVATREEIQTLETEQQASFSSSFPASTTTIGFGFSSSSSGRSLATSTNDYFLNMSSAAAIAVTSSSSSSSSSSLSTTNPITTLQPKRKASTSTIPTSSSSTTTDPMNLEMSNKTSILVQKENESNGNNTKSTEEEDDHCNGGRDLNSTKKQRVDDSIDS